MNFVKTKKKLHNKNAVSIHPSVRPVQAVKLSEFDMGYVAREKFHVFTYVFCFFGFYRFFKLFNTQNIYIDLCVFVCIDDF